MKWQFVHLKPQPSYEWYKDTDYPLSLSYSPQSIQRSDSSSQQKSAFLQSGSTKLINVISRQYFILKAWQRGAFFLDINSSNNINTKNQILNQCAGKAYTAAILQYQKNHPKCNAYVGKFQPCIKKQSDFEKCKAKVSGIFTILILFIVTIITAGLFCYI